MTRWLNLAQNGQKAQKNMKTKEAIRENKYDTTHLVYTDLGTSRMPLAS